MDLAAVFQAHRTPILVAGGGGLLGLVVLKRKKTASSTPTSAATGANTTTQAPFVTGGDPYGLANDVTNSLTPQLQSLQQQIAGLQNNPPAPPVTPPAGTVPPTAPAPPSPAPPAPATIPFNMPVFPAGESAVSVMLNPVGGWDILTNQGGLYNEGSPFYGSAFGKGTFAPGGLAVTPGGGYALTNTAGQHFTFGPP
ncbi:MAG TPA: hypothetical protein VKQ71_17655 [Acidimicrobiales bacterium]|nr:hypothetical protein [Acidimicrobiales bacterium]